MGLRIRFGSFTIGASGLRYSRWRKKGGISIPLSGKSKNSFGVFRFGPFRWFFSLSKLFDWRN